MKILRNEILNSQPLYQWWRGIYWSKYITQRRLILILSNIPTSTWHQLQMGKQILMNSVYYLLLSNFECSAISSRKQIELNFNIFSRLS